MMRREFDIFEKFHDGATIWRVSVFGRFEAERKLNELAERSENQFYMIEIQDHVLAQPGLYPSRRKISVKSAAAG